MEQMSKQKPEGNFVVIFDNVAAVHRKLFQCSRNTECIRNFDFKNYFFFNLQDFLVILINFFMVNFGGIQSFYEIVVEVKLVEIHTDKHCNFN